MFQPFVTTKPTGEGTGLGLPIAYDIVTQQHGGTIEVDICARSAGLRLLGAAPQPKSPAGTPA